jgi:hypothetical protein
MRLVYLSYTSKKSSICKRVAMASESLVKLTLVFDDPDGGLSDGITATIEAEARRNS